MNSLNTVLIGIGAILAAIVIYYVKNIMDSIRELPALIDRFREMLKDFKIMMADHQELRSEVRVLEQRIKALEIELSDVKAKIDKH
jgi:hypothetical protein